MRFEKYLNSLEKSGVKQFWLFFAVLVILTIYMMESFHPGNYVFVGHDLHLHILRFQALMEALADGRFPIYIDYEAVLGYGYPTKWFYPDVMLIPFALLGNLTNLPFAYKMLLAVNTLLSGIFMYFAMKGIYKSGYVASIGGLLYTFSFYHMQDIFERSAMGETISMTFVPLVFWGLYEIIKGDYKKWYIIAIGFACLIFSHVIATLLTFITVVIILLIYAKSMWKEKERIYYLLLAGFVSALVSAYFLFPLFEQMLSNKFFYTENIIFNVNDYTIIPIQLYRAVFGITFFPHDSTRSFLPALGSFLTIMLCLRVFIREKSAELRSVDIGVLIGFIFVLICLPIFPWTIFPFKLLNPIQFPWRFFQIITYLFVVGATYYTYRLIKTNKNRFIFSIFIIISIIITICVESANCHKKYNRQYHFTWEIRADNLYCQGTLEYAPAKIPSHDYMEERGDSVGTNYKETEILNFSRQKKGITCLDVKVQNKPETIEFPLFFYKGYSANMDGHELPVSESKNGLLQVTDVNESGKICVAYTGTLIQKVSPYISIISVLLLCIYIFKRKRKK
ncbi:MAG: YfhO family protein [Dysgonomonas sp.]|nr:YfhO family protein [Dysgonomonas sp.]